LWIASGSQAGLPELVTLRSLATQWLGARADVDALAVAARWARQLEHPHIMRTVDLVVAEQQLATVTEYHEGEVLRDLLAHEQAQQQPAPLGVALRVSLDLLDALAHLDAAAAGQTGGGRLAHGGLIPDSVLVSADGHTGLLDVATSVVAQRISALGKHPEVACYLSPEQLLHGQADERSVVFSIGVLMWEMLTAKRLFSAPDFDSVVQRVTADSNASLQSVHPAVPRPVAGIVNRALERDAIDRYPNSMSMAQAIRTAAHDAVGTRAQVAAWINALSAQSLRTRRDSLESTLGMGLGALPPRASAARGSTPSAPAAKVSVPTDLTGTAPELPATRRHHTGGNKAHDQARLAKDATDQDDATIVDPVEARAAALLDEEGSDPGAARANGDQVDEADQLPTTLYHGANAEAQERDPMPGPEVLGEPAPWARQPFFCDQKPPAPRLSSAEATPRDVPRATWPPKPVRVAPRVSTPAAAQSGTPRAPMVVPDVSAGPVAEAPAQPADPAPSVETTPTPGTDAVLVSAPGPVIGAQTPPAPTPAVTRIRRRKAATIALVAGLALAGAAALASWLRTGHSRTTSIRSPSRTPSASPAQANARGAASATGAAETGPKAPVTAGSDRVDATLTPTPEASVPPASTTAEERAQATTAAPSPSAAKAPTPKPARNPAKKFLPSDI
jgi:hypothetical protein